LASGSEQIWSYLDEETVGPDAAAALARNGLRVGVGHPDNWPDLERVLRRMTGRSLGTFQTPVLPAAPMPVTLRKVSEVQTVFVVNEDMTLTGQDHAPAENELMVSMSFDAEQRDRVLITGVPQIRGQRVRMDVREAARSVVYRPTHVIHTFDSLRFTLTARRGEFLVIGPGSQSREPTSVGHHFFVRSHEGVRQETILIIMPEVVVAHAQPGAALGSPPGGPPGIPSDDRP
jgi:hypothetical protein